MIYSPAFDALPDAVKDRVYRKLFDALSTEQTGKDARLSRDDRKAIVEILADTKPGLPDYWVSQSVH